MPATPTSTPAKCAVCERLLSESCPYTCDRCYKRVCADCVRGCEQCGATICIKCTTETCTGKIVCNRGSCARECYYCHKKWIRSLTFVCHCEKVCCRDCKTSCQNCGGSKCPGCVRTCTECTRRYCSAHNHCTQWGRNENNEHVCFRCTPIPEDKEEAQEDELDVYNEAKSTADLLKIIKKQVKHCVKKEFIYCPAPRSDDTDEAEINFNDSRHVQRRYSCKPTNWPMFSTDKDEQEPLYLGIEWELNFKPKHLDKIKDLVHSTWSGSYIWKPDGSVNPGEELVLAPRTLYSFNKDVNLSEFCKALHAAGARGYSMSQCGIHVHVPKIAFPIDDMRKIMGWFMVNRTLVRRFSQRTISQMEHYCQIPTSLSGWYNGILNSQCRNLAINRTCETWEFRIFRSTTYYPRVQAILEFVDAIINWAKSIPITLATGEEGEEKFRAFVKSTEKYQHLHNYMSAVHPENCFNIGNLMLERNMKKSDAEVAEDLFNIHRWGDDDLQDDDSDSSDYESDDRDESETETEGE